MRFVRTLFQNLQLFIVRQGHESVVMSADSSWQIFSMKQMENS